MLHSRIRIMSDPYLRPFEWLTSPVSLKSFFEEMRPKRVLHVGCGSSCLGEYIVENFASVEECVNVDIDVDTLHCMKERWMNHHDDDFRDRLKFVDADLSCRDALHQFPDGHFDLILDKSTLDCLLCSENGATGLLTHVYRLLALGGTYCTISFQPVEFLRPLLNLPAADWDIDFSVIARQVEDLVVQRVTNRSRCMKNKEADDIDNRDISADCNERNTVNVFRCVRRGVDTVDYDSVHEHILAMNNRWYKSQNPIMTSKRIQDLEESFGDEESLSIRDAYSVLFTIAEREHLTFDLFLEDWNAYTMDKSKLDTHFMSLKTAIDFLEEMQ